MSDHYKRHEEAAAKVAALLALPMPESNDVLGIKDEFNPWDIFPAIYGSYSSEYDKCAIDVLCELRDNDHKRTDLGAYMLREMLCVANLCDYGTSPRVCFPTQDFRKLLPDLIEKWRAFALISWSDGWDQD